jgi:hypothetical protein
VAVLLKGESRKYKIAGGCLIRIEREMTERRITEMENTIELYKAGWNRTDQDGAEWTRKW